MWKLIRYDIKKEKMFMLSLILMILLTLVYFHRYDTIGISLDLIPLGYVNILAYSIYKIKKERTNTLDYLTPYTKQEIVLAKILSLILIMVIYTLVVAVCFSNNLDYIKDTLRIGEDFSKISDSALRIVFVWKLFGDLIFLIFIMSCVLNLNVRKELRVNSVIQAIVAIIIIFIVKLLSSFVDCISRPIAINIFKFKSNVIDAYSFNAFSLIVSDGVVNCYVSIVIIMFLTLFVLKNTKKVARGLDVS